MIKNIKIDIVNAIKTDNRYISSPSLLCLGNIIAISYLQVAKTLKIATIEIKMAKKP